MSFYDHCHEMEAWRTLKGITVTYSSGPTLNNKSRSNLQQQLSDKATKDSEPEV